MKAKHLVLAMLGAAALTGCQNEVMSNRGYVPAPSPDAPGAMTAQPLPGDPAEIPAPAETPAPAPAPARAQVPAPAPAPAPAPRFAPMTGVVSSGGVDAAPRGGAKHGRKGAAAGEVKDGVYIVQPGDFPEKIARKLHVKLGDLMKANNLTPESAKRLRIGQKLTIPGKEAAAPKGVGARAGAKSAKNSKGAAPEVKDGIYVVQPGDFPEKIARKLHVKLGDLMKANDLTPEKASRLRIGQKLVVPGKGGAAKAAAKPAAKAAAKPAAKAAARPAAKAAPAKPAASDELKKTLDEADSAPVTNSAPAPAAPQSGNLSPRPAGGSAEVVVDSESHVVMVEESEVSVEEFARRHHKTVETLRKLNPDLKPDTTSFMKNEVVFVPGKGK